MKTSFITQILAISGLILISYSGYTYLFPQKPSDPCQVQQMKVSQFDIGTKNKSRLGLHMDYGFGSKVNKYIRHIKKAHSNTYFSEGRKKKPSLVSLTTQFKTKKKAKSAYKYLKRKWKNKKKGHFDVALKGKSVTWFRISHSTPQCFYEVVKNTKKQMGISVDRKKKKKKRTHLASKK